MRPDELNLPDRPGVYLFRDDAGQVIYVGKALSLKNRVRSYFQAVRGRTAMLSEQIADVDFIVTDGEIEALVLEINLIQRYRPRFNVRFADDKHYPYIRVSGGDFPRVGIARKMSRDGARYFGPYTVAGAVGHTLKLARQLFPFRTCPDRRLAQSGRACLYHHIRRCPGPCVGAVTPGNYQKTIDGLCLFLEGRQGRIIEQVHQDMMSAADRLEFERAAVLRDRLRALETIHTRQKAVLPQRIDRDIVAVEPVLDAHDEMTDAACVQVLQVRDGKLVGEEHVFVDGVSGLRESDIMDACLKQYYEGAASTPPEILVSAEPGEAGLIAEWLTGRAGRRVTIRVPARGSGRALVDLARGNARLHAREYQPTSCAPDRREGALSELAETLGLPSLPRRIEGYDTSASSGDQPVASMVVFTDGRPDRSGYRRFRLTAGSGADDIARMSELARRRAVRLQTGDQRFGPAPDLILVDGGETQRTVVEQELAQRGVSGIPVVGLAKEQEALYLAAGGPLLLSLHSPALQLLRHVRDEAHRFAVTYHRKKRGARSLGSALDEIPGIGPSRRRALMDRFGTVAAVRAATIEQLTSVPGISSGLAARIQEHFGNHLLP